VKIGKRTEECGWCGTNWLADAIGGVTCRGCSRPVGLCPHCWWVWRDERRAERNLCRCKSPPADGAVDAAAERLKGAEALMTALYESLTTDGYSLGRVCERWRELAGVTGRDVTVRSALQLSGGLTLNNFICGELDRAGADGRERPARHLPVGADALPAGEPDLVADGERGVRRADADGGAVVGRPDAAGGHGLETRIGGADVNGRNLGGAARRDHQQAEIDRLNRVVDRLLEANNRADDLLGGSGPVYTESVVEAQRLLRDARCAVEGAAT
jgi:hypothetical protein